MENLRPIHLVWFKRDLRVHDHKPLWEAAQRGRVLPLYIVEPTIIHAPDFDPAHWTFIAATLAELRENLAALGQPLIVRVGGAVQVLKSLARQTTLAHIWAHEETGNQLTYQRDIAVRGWAKSAEIPFTEIPQNGVVRGLKDRTGWVNLWHGRMKQKQAEIPEAIEGVGVQIGRIPTHQQLKLGRDRRVEIPKAGEAIALATLDSFLHERGDHYLQGLASPVHAPDYSSRLSPYLAWGSLSERRVVQAVRSRLYHVARDETLDRSQWKKNLKAFQSRITWRDHFIQKLESEPAVEFQNFIRALDGVREPHFDHAYFDRWCKGQTGYPLIDAAMRSLASTGWLNFRMRAMVVSFASYDLFLHWREPAQFLARAFIDYEPGIHYPQFQMQSGTTGINQIRVYDPTKQALERDPAALFIRQWIPELRRVPDLFVHEPWRMPPSVQREFACVLGQHYPKPIVDHKTASTAAHERIHRARLRPEAVAQAHAVITKHGSRWELPNKRPKHLDSPNQMTLSLGLDF